MALIIYHMRKFSFTSNYWLISKSHDCHFYSEPFYKSILHLTKPIYIYDSNTTQTSRVLNHFHPWKKNRLPTRFRELNPRTQDLKTSRVSRVCFSVYSCNDVRNYRNESSSAAILASRCE